MRVALLTISSSRAEGEATDESGERMAELADQLNAEIVGRDLVADDRAAIETRLRRWADDGLCDLILTSGGTGFSPTDVTPEATRAVIERDAPGLAEAIRLASRPHTSNWMLSRAIAGIRGSTLIINFPGSPRSIAQAGEAISDTLPHALALLGGKASPHR